MRQANKYQMFWKMPKKLSLLDIINLISILISGACGKAAKRGHAAGIHWQTIYKFAKAV